MMAASALCSQLLRAQAGKPQQQGWGSDLILFAILSKRLPCACQALQHIRARIWEPRSALRSTLDLESPPPPGDQQPLQAERRWTLALTVLEEQPVDDTQCSRVPVVTEAAQRPTCVVVRRGRGQADVLQLRQPLLHG